MENNFVACLKLYILLVELNSESNNNGGSHDRKWLMAELCVREMWLTAVQT